MKEYRASVPMPGLIPKEPVSLSSEQQVIADAIARGEKTGRALVSARDALFPPMREIMKIAGRDGLMASILGVYMAVTSEPPASKTIVPFGEAQG